MWQHDFILGDPGADSGDAGKSASEDGTISERTRTGESYIYRLGVNTIPNSFSWRNEDILKVDFHWRIFVDAR